MSDAHPENSQMDPSSTGEEIERRLGQLDQEIAQTVRNLVHELQHKLGESIRQSSNEILRKAEEDILRRLESVEPELPASYVPSAEVKSLVLSAAQNAAASAASAAASAERRAQADRPDLEALLAAVGRVDGATTQAEIVKTLVHEARGFASRVAFFLVRVGEVRGFAGEGWNGSGPEIEGLRFEVPSSGAWEAVVRGASAIRVDGEECRRSAEALGHEAGREGILVPFVLRGQLAGVLYADRTGDGEGEPSGGAADFPSLQLLTYAATQALETSAVNPGTSAALLTESRGEAPERPLWQPTQEAAPAGAVAEAPAVPQPEPVEPTTHPAPAPATGEMLETTPERVERLPEPEPSELLAPEAPSMEAPSMDAAKLEAPALEAPALEAPALEAQTLEAPTLEAPDSPEPGAPHLEASPAMATPPVEAPPAELPSPEPTAVSAPEPPPPPPEGDEDDASIFETATNLAAVSVEAEPATPAVEPPPVVEPASIEPTADIWEEDEEEPTVVGATTAAATTAAATTAAEGPPASPMASPPAETFAAPPAVPPPATDPMLGQATVRLDRSQLEAMQTPGPPPIETPVETPVAPPPSQVQPPPENLPSTQVQPPPDTPLPPGLADGGPAAPQPPAAAAPPAAAPPAPPPASGGSTEVRPPDDLEGPGLAFAAPSADNGAVAEIPAGDEVLHEEARRLARLLVSEIKLYNEEVIEEGRLAGNIYSRLKEDIDRSRQMYQERIDPRIQEDYFYQELVQRLADGKTDLLGM